MQTFKKVLLSVVLFVMALIILSVIIICPFLHSNDMYYSDAKMRENLSGQIDFLISGASNSMCGLDPRIIDQELGCFSYNLSNHQMPVYARKWMLTKELSRNPVKTVVIDLSYDTLNRDPMIECAEGDTRVWLRLDSFSERISYMIQNDSMEDWLNIYSRLFVQGMHFWKTKALKGTEDAPIDEELKGFLLNNEADITLSDDESMSMYNSDKLTLNYRSDNIEDLREIVDICKDSNIRTIVTVMPLADAWIWTHTGWDDFHKWLTDFCNEQDCELYDFNLLKSRYDLFNDKCSFVNGTHLSSEGGERATRVFCEIINAKNSGENTSDLFYNSYQEMKQDSPYMKVLSLHDDT